MIYYASNLPFDLLCFEVDLVNIVPCKNLRNEYHFGMVFGNIWNFS